MVSPANFFSKLIRCLKVATAAILPLILVCFGIFVAFHPPIYRSEMLNIHLLKNIAEIPGPPGFEGRIREFIIDEIKSLVDSYEVDAIGNIIAFRKGKEDRRMMLSAHMDEIGFIVSHIEEDGFLRFHPLGGYDPKTLTAQRVIIHGKKDIIGVMGSKPLHIMSDEDRKKAPELEDYFIDTGFPKDEIIKWVDIGSPITRERELIEMGPCVNAKSLDNRLSVYVLIEALRNLKEKELPFDIYAVFSVQEEVGLRGATSASHRINPQFGIALDVTIAYDTPGAKDHEMITRLGKGAAIKIMDSQTICDSRMVAYLKKVAEDHDIAWQAEVLHRGGTDTAAIQRSGKDGAIAGAISIPLRHIHQVIEMAHKEDVANGIKLLEHAILEISTYPWQKN